MTCPECVRLWAAVNDLPLWKLDDEEDLEAVERVRAALAAGVGVPPDARPLQINPEPLAVVERHDNVSAVNWIRGRSREDRLRVWLALGGTEADFPDAAVGEARPAEPPTEDLGSALDKRTSRRAGR